MLSSRVVTVGTVLVICLSMACTGPGAPEPLPEDLRVSIEPHWLALEPEESGVVIVTVMNTGNDTYYVLVRTAHVDAPGRTHSRVAPPYLEVSPQNSAVCRITVTSYAHRGQDPDISDMEIRVYWSRTDDPKMDVNDTDEGSFSYEYEVVDEFDEFAWWLPSAIILVIIIVAFGLLLVRRRGDGPGAMD